MTVVRAGGGWGVWLRFARRSFIEALADAGRHARSAAGMQQLHYGMAIEVEGNFETDT